MKKLKNSVKAIIFSVVAVVVAVSAVLAVVLLRKDGNNPPASNNRYILTNAQLDLVNSINAQADKEQAESQKDFEVYSASRFETVDGEYVSADKIQSFGADYFITNNVVAIIKPN